MLTLRNSIVPMLNPPPFSEDGIRIICDVSRRVNTGAACFQIFVHDDAVISAMTVFSKSSVTGTAPTPTTTRSHESFSFVTQEHSLNCIFSFQCGDTCLFYNPHSTCGVILFEES